ncbi:MAG: UbiA family prenyltransferase [Candidatus Methanoperedens sp.]|nr:UbiA family prenyltransferase [Candidatus Methanoperedens sp.]
MNTIDNIHEGHRLEIFSDLRKNILINLILNKFTSFLISTSLFLAINGSMLVIFSGFLYNIFVFNTAILTFLITFGIYGLNKLTDMKEDAINRPERASLITKIKPILKFFVAISFLLSLILGLQENIMTLFILIFPLFIGVLYSVKLSSNIPRLKDITGVKNITIALSWAVIASFLPAIYSPDKRIIVIILIFVFFF